MATPNPGLKPWAILFCPFGASLPLPHLSQQSHVPPTCQETIPRSLCASVTLCEICQNWSDTDIPIHENKEANNTCILPNITIMKFILPFLSLFLLFLSPLSAAKLPNIMVFLIDDMGVMDTSVPFLTDEKGKPKKYPLNHHYRTPGMERLAKQGIRFNQFYAMSVCSPTRISIMTGQNAARHRATNWINPRGDNRGANGPNDWNWAGLKKGDVTLPGVLRTNGYKTIHVGKAHFGPMIMKVPNP